MKSKKWFFSLVFALSMVVSIASPNAFAEENWIEIDSKNETDVNKPWTITFSEEVDQESVTDSNIYIEQSNGEKIAINQPEITGNKIIISPKESYKVGNTYTMYILSSIESIDGEYLVGNTKFTFSITSPSTGNSDVQITEPGEYGNTTYNGDVTISSAGVTLKNAVIKGDLIVAESVGEGEVYFDYVTVEGETTILGGGENSIYFTDSVLATVIVNKNTGAIRVVVQGNSMVEEVYLESAATLQENNVTGDGYKNIAVQESVQNSDGNVSLIGTFDTINVRATNVEIKLDQETSIEELVLSAVAQVTGQGSINILNVGANATGSSVDTRPHSTVLDISSYVNIAGEEITESYSDSKEANIESITATPAFIIVKFNQSIAGLSTDDFDVTATKNGTPINLTGITYEPNAKMIFFDPIAINNDYGETIEVTVKPSTTNTSLTGSASTTFENQLGFAGRITDIYGIGVANVTVSSSMQDDYYYSRGVTDENGYYFVPTYYPGVFEGKISGPGYLDGTILATVASNSIKTNVNETIMRAASSNEWKIMLTWNGEESDVDSHLATEYFHVYYAEREYVGADGYEYVDLDWDDVDYYGPETTTIRKFQDGRYIFFLHNYSGEKPLHASDSKVQVFKGNSTEPDYVFNVPNDTENARYWGVFELYVTNNGDHIELKPLDAIAHNEYVLLYPKEAIKDLIDRAKTTGDIEANLATAIQNAESVLSNSNATTKQLLDAYYHLNKTAPTYVDLYSWIGTLSGNTRVENGDFDSWELEYKLGKDIIWNLSVNDNAVGWFFDNDTIELSLDVTQQNSEGYFGDAFEGLKVKLINPITGNEQIYTTDSDGHVSFGTFTYEEYNNLSDVALQFLFEGTGRYEVIFNATALNREEYGYPVMDAINHQLVVFE